MNSILEVIDTMNNGGVYSFVKSIIENKKNSFEIDIAAVIISEKSFAEELKKYRTRIYHIGVSGYSVMRKLRAFNDLRKVCLKKGYVCIHIHSDTAYKLFLSGLAGKSVGVKKIVLHSHSTAVDNSHRRIKYVIHSLCKPLLPYIATDFLSCSSEASKWMYPKEILNRVKIINNGIDINNFKFSQVIRDKVRENLFGGYNYFVIGHVGRFTYQKNHEFLIRVFKEVYICKNNARLLLIGEGELEDIVRVQIKECGLEDVVYHIRSTPNVNQYMQAMDVFLLSSHSEGFPLVAVEAQTAGLPCILSDQISKEVRLCDLVRFCPIDQEASTWVSAICNIKDKVAERSKYAEEIEKRGFSIETTVGMLKEIYN